MKNNLSLKIAYYHTVKSQTANNNVRLFPIGQISCEFYNKTQESYNNTVLSPRSRVCPKPLPGFIATPITVMIPANAGHARRLTCQCICQDVAKKLKIRRRESIPLFNIPCFIAFFKPVHPLGRRAMGECIRHHSPRRFFL